MPTDLSYLEYIHDIRKLIVTTPKSVSNNKIDSSWENKKVVRLSLLFCKYSIFFIAAATVSNITLILHFRRPVHNADMLISGNTE